eukprot:2338871-Rhodomonas_salina.2
MCVCAHLSAERSLAGRVLERPELLVPPLLLPRLRTSIPRIRRSIPVGQYRKSVGQYPLFNTTGYWTQRDRARDTMWVPGPAQYARKGERVRPAARGLRAGSAPGTNAPCLSTGLAVASL